jgi:hypothetical protein
MAVLEGGGLLVTLFVLQPRFGPITLPFSPLQEHL